MKKLLVIAAMVLGLFAVGCDDDFAPSTALSTSFFDAYPNAVDVEWEWKRGRKYRVAEFKLNGQECEAWYTKSDEWVLTEYHISFSDLPEAVQTAFTQGYGASTPVDDVYRVERSKGETLYTIESVVIVNGFDTDIFLTYTADGTLVREWVEEENYDYLYYWL
ncbi:MAG: PepSY-like domain-containing protein [Alistipes sp.]|nr:PepSY-like domain-containing protein [Alistipes sp.]